jgi:hypothetical protein
MSSSEFPDLAARYPRALIEQRDRVATSGTFRQRVQFDLVERPQHAFGLLAAADVAAFAEVDEIVAIEFGVAEGAGLRNLAGIASRVTAETGIDIKVVGFDSGRGLPSPLDYRDHPEIWAAGDFAMGDPARLRSTLPEGVELVLGPVADTLPQFVELLTKPIGFVSFDLDLYSSTRDALALFGSPSELLLPIVISYFDDVIGGAHRIGSLFRTSAAGQLLAIEEFNSEHEKRQIDTIRILPHRRPLDREIWIERTYALHVLDHPCRSVGSTRTAMSMVEHGRNARFEWPL